MTPKVKEDLIKNFPDVEFYEPDFSDRKYPIVLTAGGYWMFYHQFSYDTITLDGQFTAEQLRALADYLEEYNIEAVEKELVDSIHIKNNSSTIGDHHE